MTHTATTPHTTGTAPHQGQTPAAPAPGTEPKRTRYPIERYNRITTVRFSTQDQRKIAELLDERIRRTGRNHFAASLIRELIRAEHKKRC